MHNDVKYFDNNPGSPANSILDLSLISESDQGSEFAAPQDISAQAKSAKVLSSHEVDGDTDESQLRNAIDDYFQEDTGPESSQNSYINQSD